MFYIRLLLIGLWLVISCVLGLIFCLFQWGNLNLDRRFGRLFAHGVLRICGLKMAVLGEEHMFTQPCVYVANHQTAMDMATFGSIYPSKTVVIGKKEIMWIPFFGLFFYAAGNIIIDRQKRVKAIAGIDKAVERIHSQGLSIWIFPEGTRNRTKEPLLPFKKGAFYMALQAKIPIVPIVCQPMGGVVSWKLKKMKSGTIRMKVLPPIQTDLFREDQVDNLSDLVRKKMIEALRGLSIS